MNSHELSEQEQNVLLEYLSKKTHINEISIALHKKIGTIKFYIRSLVVQDLNNGFTKPQVCEKYNLEENHLQSILNKLEKKENKRIKREQQQQKDKDSQRTKPKSKEDKMIQLLTEIRDALRTLNLQKSN